MPSDLSRSAFLADSKESVGNRVNALSDRVLKTIVSIDIICNDFSEGAKIVKNEAEKRYYSCVLVAAEKCVLQSCNKQYLCTHMALFKGFSNASYNAE